MKKILTYTILLFHFTLFGQETYFEYKDSNYQPFIANGKMGLKDKTNNKTVLKAQYEFVAQTANTSFFYTIENNKIQLIDVDLGTVILPTANKSIKEYYNNLDESLLFVIDNKLTYKETHLENGDIVWELTPHTPLEKPSSGLELINTSLLLMYYNNIETIPVWDEFGEQEYDEFGDPIETSIGGQYAGLFDTKSLEWKLTPKYTSIQQVYNGFLAIESDRDTDITYFYNFFDKELNLLISHKKSKEFTLSDSLTLLPKGAQLIKSVETNYAYFQVNGKMGACKFDFLQNEIKTKIPPIYDFVLYIDDLGRFICIDDDKIIDVLADNNYNDNPFPVKAKKTIKLWLNYETGETYLALDGKEFENVYDEKNTEKWAKSNFNKNGNTLVFELNLLGKNRILINISSIEIIEEYDDLGEPLYDEETGDIIFDFRGTLKAGVFSLGSKNWLKDFYSKIEKINRGFLVSNIQSYDYYSNTYLVGYCDNDLNLKIDLKYGSIVEAEDILIVSKGNKTGSIDFNGNTILEFDAKHSGVNYKNGFYFSAGGEPILDEFDEYMYDEETGDELFSEQILKDKIGNDINIDYDGFYLHENGILEVAKKGENSTYGDILTGFYNLNTNKIIESPKYKVIYTKNDNKLWLENNEEWGFYKIGSSITPILNKKYNSVDVIRKKDSDFYIVKINKNEELLNENGKTILKNYSIENTIEANNQAAFLLEVSKNRKKGIFEAYSESFLLKPIYDSIKHSYNGYITVYKNGKYGLTHKDSLRKLGNSKWIIQPNSSNRPYVKGELLYIKEKNNTGVYNMQLKQIVPPNYKFVSPLYPYMDEIDYIDDMDDFIGGDYNYFLVSNKIDGELLSGVYETGEGLIVPIKYHAIELATSNAFLYVKMKTTEKDFESKYKIGIWDFKTNSEIIPPKYAKVYKRTQKETTYWVKINNLFGMLDSVGNSLIEPSFTKLGRGLSYYDDRMYIYKTNKKGVFDINKHKILLNPEYDEIEWSEYSRSFIVKKDGKFGLINDSTYTYTLPLEYDNIRFQNNHFILNKEGKISIRKPKDKGEIMVNDIDEFEDFDSYFKIRKNGAISLLELDSLKTVWSGDYNNVIYNYSSFILVKNDKMGLMDNDFNLIIPVEYDFINELNINNYVVGNKNPWAYLDQTFLFGAINQKGELIVPIEYNSYNDSYNNVTFTKKGVTYKLTKDGSFSKEQDD